MHCAWLCAGRRSLYTVGSSSFKDCESLHNLFCCIRSCSLLFQSKYCAYVRESGFIAPVVIKIIRFHSSSSNLL